MMNQTIIINLFWGRKKKGSLLNLHNRLKSSKVLSNKIKEKEFIAKKIFKLEFILYSF
jgi:hypothetical protein